MSTSTTARPASVSKTVARDLPDGSYLEIHVEERDDSGTLSPGFSITGSLWEKRGTWSGRARARNGRDSDLGGCIHEEILKHAPHLEPIVKVHLADQDGTPMHALANGWYEYTGKSQAYEIEHYGQAYADRRGTPHERAAEALHIPAADLPEGLDQGGFADFVQSLVETWEAQAGAARQILSELVDGLGVEDRVYGA